MAGDPEQRKSKSEQTPPVSDPEEIARIEAENGLRQIKFATDTIDERLQGDGRLLLKPSFVLNLNRLAIEGLSDLPGSYRPGQISISKSRHVPPAAADVPGHVEDMCDYVNDNWNRDAWHLAAYLMWRLNWIHPFKDGNGRTSRAASYIVLCVKLGLKLPGQRTIPEVIAEDKRAYYAALDKADDAANQGGIDVTAMEGVLKDALTKQLADFADTVTGGHLTGAPATARNVSGQVKSRWTSKLHEHYNRYPFWYGCAALVLAIAGILLS